jgi:hypothetical protein
VSFKTSTLNPVKTNDVPAAPVAVHVVEVSTRSAVRPCNGVVFDVDGIGFSLVPPLSSP